MIVELKNVIDVRTNKHYSVVRVNEKKAKWFIPADEEKGE